MGQMASVGRWLMFPPKAAVLVHRPATLRRPKPSIALPEGGPISPFALNSLMKVFVSVSKTLAGGRSRRGP